MSESGSSGQPPKPRKLFRWGALGTLFYLLCVASYVTSRWSAFEALAPNELGDFAAGAFSPLAFFWLVLGFIQQGEELRNSGTALWLQGEELRNSVEQQRQLVETTREQLLYEKDRAEQDRLQAQRAAQPILRMSATRVVRSSGKYFLTYSLINSGAECTDLKFKVDQPLDASSGLGWISRLGRGEAHEIVLVFQAMEFQNLHLTIEYMNSLGERDAVVFRFQAGGPQGERTLAVDTLPLG